MVLNKKSRSLTDHFDHDWPHLPPPPYCITSSSSFTAVMCGCAASCCLATEKANSIEAFHYHMLCVHATAISVPDYTFHLAISTFYYKWYAHTISVALSCFSFSAHSSFLVPPSVQTPFHLCAYNFLLITAMPHRRGSHALNLKHACTHIHTYTHTHTTQHMCSTTYPWCMLPCTQQQWMTRLT